MTLHININKRLGQFDLQAQLEIAAGLTALFGPSGAGKTSLINAIAGLLTPDNGEITLNDRVLFHATERLNIPVHKRRVGYVFQGARLFPHLTTLQNLRFGGRHDEDAVIAMLGLEAVLQRYPSTLSGGETQRVALGRALMSKPDVLLMDEPLAALDAKRKSQIIPYFRALKSHDALAIVYVTHDFEEVLKLADNIVAMSDGVAVDVGPIASSLAHPALIALLAEDQLGTVVEGTALGVDDASGNTVIASDLGQLEVPSFFERGAQVRLWIPSTAVRLNKTGQGGLLGVVESIAGGRAVLNSQGHRIALASGAGRELEVGQAITFDVFPTPVL